MKVLLGLVAGAGASYGIYKLVSGRRKHGKKAQGDDPTDHGPRKQPAATRPLQPGTLLEKVSGLSMVRGTGSRAAGVSSSGEILSKSPGSLEPQHLEMLLSLLQSSPDPSERTQILVTLGNSAAFSVNQELIRDMGGLQIIGNLLPDPVFEIRVQALNALNNLSMNVRNQEQLQVYISQVLEMIETSPVNSDLQMAALRLLTNLSVTNNYQHLMKNSITLCLSLLVVGNEILQTQVLKVLVNLSANHDMVEDILRAQAPASLVLLFDSCTNTAVLLRALTFLGNMKDWRPSTPIRETLNRSKDSLFCVLFGDTSPLHRKLPLLLSHPDSEVKAQVARLLT
ncbi:ARM10 protein, partial [Amia calva]|nr:ARM10 protein [Amia calva]